MSGIFGGGQPAGQVIQTQQQTNPLSPYIGQIGQGAQNAYQGFQVSPNYLSGLSQTANRGFQGTNPIFNTANMNLTDTLSGKYLDPSTNPYLRSAVDTGLGLAQSKYTSLYGGNAGQNINNSGFREQDLRTLGEVGTQAYATNYQQERQRQLQAASLVPITAQTQQGLDYANLGAATEAGQAQQNVPFLGVKQFANTLGLAPSGGSNTTTSSPYFTNPAANALGLGIGASSLYGMGNQSGLWSGLGGMFGGGGSIAGDAFLPGALWGGGGDIGGLLSAFAV